MPSPVARVREVVVTLEVEGVAEVVMPYLPGGARHFSSGSIVPDTVTITYQPGPGHGGVGIVVRVAGVWRHPDGRLTESRNRVDVDPHGEDWASLVEAHAPRAGVFGLPVDAPPSDAVDAG